MSKHVIYPELAEIGKRIKAMRIQKNVSPEQMARSANMTVDRYLAIEQGSNLTVIDLDKFCKKLKVTPKQMLG